MENHFKYAWIRHHALKVVATIGITTPLGSNLAINPQDINLLTQWVH